MSKNNFKKFCKAVRKKFLLKLLLKALLIGLYIIGSWFCEISLSTHQDIKSYENKKEIKLSHILKNKRIYDGFEPEKKFDKLSVLKKISPISTSCFSIEHNNANNMFVIHGKLNAPNTLDEMQYIMNNAIRNCNKQKVLSVQGSNIKNLQKLKIIDDQNFFEFGQTINEGHLGKIFKIIGNEKYVAKELKENELDCNTSDYQRMQDMGVEFSSLKFTSRPFCEITLENKTTISISKLRDGGSIRDLILKNKENIFDSSDDLLTACATALCSLARMSENGTVYIDSNPGNILIKKQKDDKYLKFVFTDFKFDKIRAKEMIENVKKKEVANFAKIFKLCIVGYSSNEIKLEEVEKKIRALFNNSQQQGENFIKLLQKMEPLSLDGSASISVYEAKDLIKNILENQGIFERTKGRKNDLKKELSRHSKDVIGQDLRHKLETEDKNFTLEIDELNKKYFKNL